MPKIIRDEEIFVVTCRLLEEQGFDGMTTKLIAERAGVNEATLFRKYESKTQLVIRAANHVFSTVAFASVTWSGDLREDLIALVVSYLHTSRQYGFLLQTLMVEASRHPELGPATKAVRNNIKRIVDMLDRYRMDGRLRGSSGMDILASLIGPLAMAVLVPPLPSGRGPQSIDAAEYVWGFLHGRAIGANTESTSEEPIR